MASPPARASRRATRGRSALAANRVLLMIMLCSGIVICSIFTLVTWSWWLTALSVAVLAGAALLVFRLVIETTTVVEKPSAEVVARLEDEGVADAEELLNVRTRRAARRRRQRPHRCGGRRPRPRGDRAAHRTDAVGRPARPRAPRRSA